MKMIYISDNGYQGKYKDKCLIVYNNENSEVARYYKECSVQDVVEEIECFPGFLKSLHYRCKNCEHYYNNACKLWHEENGECKPVRPYQSSCRDFKEVET